MPSFSVGRVRPVYKGGFDPAIPYGPLERVTYDFDLYEAVRDVPAGTDPSANASIYWVKISAAGAPGPPGEGGPTGPAGPPGPSMPISDSVTSPDSGVAASSKAVKTAYDKAVEGYDKAVEAAAKFPVSIANGGTGAATAAGALTNLGAAPRPTSAAGVGQVYFELNLTNSTTLTLPAGGTWMHHFTVFTPAGAWQNTRSGISAGGYVVTVATAGSWRGLAWRIT